jgi:hypothetical protein
LSFALSASTGFSAPPDFDASAMNVSPELLKNRTPQQTTVLYHTKNQKSTSSMAIA